MSGAHKGKASRVTQFQEIEETVSGQAPLVCGRCLGPSNMLRMTKEAAGKKCAVCSKPFTVFSWKIATDARQKTTVICRSCAEGRKKCQSCLGMMSNSSSNETANNRQREDDNDDEQQGQQHPKPPSNSAIVSGHKAKICSFFLKGQCTRGSGCPFSHSLPSAAATNNDSSANNNTIGNRSNNIKDRFFANDVDAITQQQLALMGLLGTNDNNINNNAPSQHQRSVAAQQSSVAAVETKPVAPTQHQSKPAAATSQQKSGFGFDWMGAIQ